MATVYSFAPPPPFGGVLRHLFVPRDDPHRFHSYPSTSAAWVTEPYQHFSHPIPPPLADTYSDTHSYSSYTKPYVDPYPIEDDLEDRTPAIKRQRYTAADRALLLQLNAEGLPIREIAERMGRSLGSVGAKLWKLQGPATGKGKGVNGTTSFDNAASKPAAKKARPSPVKQRIADPDWEDTPAFS
ncbi:hypothetical protein JCM8097_008365 [Rhodosporidiobolus ruineniae]